MAAQDIIHDADFNPLVKNGDFVVEASDEQHVGDILYAMPGAYKLDPGVGVGISRAIRSRLNNDGLNQLMRSQLVLDGYKVEVADLITGQVKVTRVR